MPSLAIQGYADMDFVHGECNGSANAAVYHCQTCFPYCNISK